MTPARMAELHAASFTTPRPWTEAEFAALIADPAILLAEEADGFAVGRIILDEAEVLTVAVDPAARRKGVGTRLLGELLDRMALAGVATTHLEVAADNAPARALYAAAGFSETGRRKGYYLRPDGQRIDAVVMCRTTPDGNAEV